MEKPDDSSQSIRRHISRTEYLKGEVHQAEGSLIASTLLVGKGENIYWSTTKMKSHGNRAQH